MDSRTLKLILNTLLILAFLVVARDYAVSRKKSRTYEEQVKELKAEIVDLRKEADTLRDRVRKLESDPATLEKIARDRLKMIAPGEEIILPDTEMPAAKSPGRAKAARP